MKLATASRLPIHAEVLGRVVEVISAVVESIRALLRPGGG